MSTRVDVEEIQTTKSEKLLAVVLTIFLLIGGIWAYQRIDDEVRDAVGVERVEPSPEDRAAVQRLERGARPPRIDTLLRIAGALDCELVVDLRPRTRAKGAP